jgi:class 3 adenylate cyclase
VIRPGVQITRLAWAICLLTLAVVSAAIVLVLVNLESIQNPDQANAIEIILPIGFAILGGVVAARQPSNVLGWLFLAIALLNAIPGPTTQYTRLALVTRPGMPFSPWIPWIGDLASTFVYPAGLAAMIMLVIPNGRLLSPRWRVVAWAGVVTTVLLATVTLLDPVAITFEGLPDVPNPTGLPELSGISQGPIGVVAFLGALLVLLMAGGSVVLRLRRARGEERLQLRWVAYAAAISILANIVMTLVGILFIRDAFGSLLGTMVTIAGFGIALPASFGVAILRYRLYDLDLLLNRTLLYGAVSVVLAGALLGANLLTQQLLESVFNRGSDLVTAALGVAAGLAFAPMRRTIRPLIDRALPARSRLTLLFTDIVESTQAIVDLGDERWRDVLHQYRAMVRQALSRHRGREVNTAGDAFFAVFDRPINGVRCATAMRGGVKELGLRVRTGLHCDEVQMRGEQVTGLAVHAAARVMGFAREDQIVISEDMALALDGAVPLRDAGRHQLRGVPGEWQLFEVAG